MDFINCYFLRVAGFVSKVLLMVHPIAIIVIVVVVFIVGVVVVWDGFMV